MADANDFNEQIIEEFRGNAGVVGGPFEGASLLILHSKGAKSGTERLNPLLCFNVDGGGVAIIASAAGGPKHPAWFHNLIANPDVTMEIGAETDVKVKARNTDGAERDKIYADAKANFAGFAEYEKSTDRTFPVFVLDRA